MQERKNDSIKMNNVSEKVTFIDLIKSLKEKFTYSLLVTLINRCCDDHLTIEDKSAITNVINELRTKSDPSLQEQAILCILYYADNSVESHKALTQLLKSRKVAIDNIMKSNRFIVSNESELFNAYTLIVMCDILGRFSFRSAGFENNKANVYTEKAAALGNTLEQEWLLEKKLQEYQKLAELGNENSQYELASLYHKLSESGSYDRRREDEKQAFFWYKKAAAQGHVESIYNTGLMYNMRPNERFPWWLEAAKRGHAKAQYGVALMYHGGIGVEQNINESVKWYLEAAKQGITDAQTEIAAAYSEGIGVKKDLNEAVQWLWLAFENYLKEKNKFKVESIINTLNDLEMPAPTKDIIMNAFRYAEAKYHLEQLKNPEGQLDLSGMTLNKLIAREQLRREESPLSFFAHSPSDVKSSVTNPLPEFSIK